jgi:CDP-glucose 4,6-dehydratase
MDHFSWRGKTVLVAGATGFLGGWIIRRLLDYDARVISIDRGTDKPSQFAIKKFSDQTITLRGDIRSPEFVRGIFEQYQIDVFFHAAYGADVNRVLQEPMECFRSSVESTWLILDLLRQHQPNCISVISSTDKAYGAQKLPYQESNGLTPIHPYEVAKASQDLAAQSFGKIYGLPVAVTRCGNYFGPYDFNFTRLIPDVCACLSQDRPPVLRSDGKFTRDFLYIEDAVDVQLLLAERLAADRSIYGEAFNFSYGEQIPVIDLVRKIARMANSEVKPVVANTVKSEIRDMHLSSRKAEKLLGWKPTVGFERGLRRTIEWYLKYFRSKSSTDSKIWRTASALFVYSGLIAQTVQCLTEYISTASQLA